MWAVTTAKEQVSGQVGWNLDALLDVKLPHQNVGHSNPCSKGSCNTDRQSQLQP